MNKPNFLIIGAAKAGTTSLWDLLNQHPQICMSREKETRFFSHEERYAAGWDWYDSLFRPDESTRVLGEVTPHYSMVNLYPKAVERISHFLPDVKIIYSVRDPATALPSFWKQLCAHGFSFPEREHMPDYFEDAILRYTPMVELVRYWHNLNTFRQFFPDSRIHLIFFEDFVRNPESTLAECCQFLGVEKFTFKATTDARNVSKGKIQRPKWARKLYGTKLWAAGKRLAPAGIRKRFIKLVSRPIPDNVPWSEKSIEHLRAAIGVDIRETLAYGNKPVDFWKGFPPSAS